MCENMNSSGPLLERSPNKCILLTRLRWWSLVIEAQAGLWAPWFFRAPLGFAGCSSVRWLEGGESVQVYLAQRPRVCLPTSARAGVIGTCFQTKNWWVLQGSGHAVLVTTGHHAVGYLQDNTWEMFLVLCRKTTGFRPITGLCLELRWLSARLSLTGKWNQCPSLACGEDYERISQLSVVKDLKNSYSVSSKSS